MPSQQSNGSDITKLTTQQAWVKAIELLGEEDTHTSNEDQSNNEKVAIEELAVMEIIHNLGSTTSNTAGVPRKLETFIKYCHRNSRRLLPTYPDLHSWGSKDVGVAKDISSEPIKKKQKRDHKREIPTRMRTIAQTCFAKIQQKQRPLLNLPKPTEDWESATGQLHLLGFGEYSHWVSTSSTNNCDSSTTAKLYVVHRLDCQTSGILVVARNQESASTLCKAWRDRDVVKKVYLAHVKRWPPYHEHKVNEGTIDIPLAASRTERIIWEKRPISDGGKQSKTYWKIHKDLDNTVNKEGIMEKKGVILELHPITGRTHQESPVSIVYDMSSCVQYEVWVI